METIPATNIFGVYLETGKPDEEKDFNAPLNDTAKPFNQPGES